MERGLPLDRIGLRGGPTHHSRMSSRRPYPSSPADRLLGSSSSPSPRRACSIRLRACCGGRRDNWGGRESGPPSGGFPHAFGDRMLVMRWTRPGTPYSASGVEAANRASRAHLAQALRPCLGVASGPLCVLYPSGALDVLLAFLVLADILAWAARRSVVVDRLLPSGSRGRHAAVLDDLLVGTAIWKWVKSCGSGR